MICNKCGRENPDEALACQACGHKLQSGRAPGGPGARGLEPLPLLTGRDPLDARRAARLREAWAVALAVALGWLGFSLAEMVWPVLALGALAAAWALLRGIGWRD
ncbi:hypothetical protein NNJEOMEG_01834 [Fundidesulfovibrio magnetotacticus]|uniref:Zinc-ribbon domain-containing protein n=1 Tax=Fundidesulfovibrio magnetotacticus TaxID=2730080 RepID=A0A6V8LW07_9BACT|nr:zinc ribbon domain-containing protein [Fundidesulfovibrio magnetotacticus]GFK93996.1 hypothetical protein NNJEOMEG_01834 [Fundidesulfovibrio magnetotacticus]